MARFFLMHKDRRVAVLEVADKTADILEVEEILAPEHYPVGCRQDVLGLRGWWKSRGIPASRQGLREALAVMGVPYAELLLLKCNGLSLTDHYWITPCERPQQWSQVNFFQNDFSGDVGRALFGEQSDALALDLKSPCCTSDGFLKKRWQIADGRRVLVKGGMAPYFQEPLNECVASTVYELLGIPHVPYTLVWENGQPYSVCPCFVTPATEFIPAVALLECFESDEETPLWQHFLLCCDRLGIPNAQRDTSQMLAVDFLLANTDRHFRNFGALRDPDTLQWIGMAPVFDSGTSLWKLDQTNFIAQDRYDQCRPFAQRHTQQLALLDPADVVCLPWHKLQELPALVEKILSQSDYVEPERIKAIAGRVEQNLDHLLSHFFVRPIEP